MNNDNLNIDLEDLDIDTDILEDDIELPIEENMPALAMRGIVIFEKMTTHFDVGRKASISALKKAMNEDRKIFLVAQREAIVEVPTQDDLYEYGVVASIKQMIKNPDGIHRVLVYGEYRARLKKITSTEPFLQATVEEAPINPDMMFSDEETTALTRVLKTCYEEFASNLPKPPSQEFLGQLFLEDDPEKLFELIAFNTMLSYQNKQTLLEENDLYSRLSVLVSLLFDETEVLKIEKNIYEQVRSNIDKNQRDFFLREQMRVISEELGDSESTEDEAFKLRKTISAIKSIDEDSRTKLLKDVDKLSRLPSSSQEANVIRTYLEACLELPWDNMTKEKIDIVKSAKILDKDHYGMTKVKERILEFLAVRKLSPEMKGQIICLVGPPGVGKTSIGKSVAKAMNRKYTRLSLGGVHDESDIRGHRKTYVGAMPGRIVNALSTVKVKNPLILLDEIDKMGSDFKGDPSSAMLEVLDSEQNNAFRDHYIELPFDLSEVVFITTANDVSTIPAPLLDRMELIELSSYTREEKWNIAKKHLISKQVKKHGLTAKDMAFTKDGIYALIDSYTRESGVRKLERTIASVCRKVAKEKVSLGEEFKKMSITPAVLEDMLGSKKFRPSKVPDENMVGIVTGLAWTSVGGETLEIEVSVMEGTGKIEITGNLGKVMTESSKLACSYVRNIAKNYGIDPNFYKDKDIHIHAPEGAVPKDGPSAGVTMTTALVSALGNIPVRSDVAMTGEISLTGRVMPIGGLKEKSIAAYRAGVKTVIIPYDNKPDIDDFDDIIKENIHFMPVKTIKEVLDIALVFDPTSITIDTQNQKEEDLIILQNNDLQSSTISCKK